MARIYVGTYAKYNAGSIAGEWLDLEDYIGRDTFYRACAALHRDELDPEFMFQDWEDIPDGMVSESHVSEDLWEWLELDEDDRELLAVYREDVDQSGSIETAREAFNGKWSSEEDFAQDLYEELGYCDDKNPLLSYVDWERVARDLRIGGDYVYVRKDGEVWVFRGDL